MNLLYTVNRKSFPKFFSNQKCLYNGQSLCSLSSRNILLYILLVAFTTMTELDDSSGKTRSCHVYIADLNMPWHAYKMLSNKHNITALEWDLPSDKLVMADTAGTMQLWMFKDHILNDWLLIGSTYFPGEHILGAGWFHTGKKTGLVTEKKDSIHYSEKFYHLLFASSVKQFCGRAAESVLVVSTTGMVGAIMITKDLQNSICYSIESFGNTRHRITVVDLCYEKNGHFLIALSSSSICLPIKCFRVLVRKNNKYTITLQALPNFFLQDGTSKDNSCAAVTFLKFMIREDADSLVIAANSESGGFVEVWELREKSQSVHKLFQPKTLEPFKTVVWQYHSQYRCQSPFMAIATTELSIVTTVPPPNYVIIALADSSVHYLNLDCLKKVTFSSLNTNWRSDEPSNKYFKSSVSIAHMDLSWLECVLLACDTHGNLYFYKLLPYGTTSGTAMSLSYACTLLEYCVVTELNWLDILLCLRSSMIEALCERLNVSFNRQLQFIQQYHIQFLYIKTSLCRMLVAGQNKAADLSSLLMVHSVATAFKSLLRPSDLISHDKGPTESLAAVITDVDKDQDKCNRIDTTFRRIVSFKEGGTIACTITNTIAFMIAKDNLPLSVVENEGFQQLMKTVARLYHLPSRKKITNLLDLKYDILKSKFINNIKDVSSFTVTCDIWTDISNKSYLGVTVHYLKTETLLTKGTIGVIPLEDNHTSDYIKNELLSVFQNFEINLSKIMAIVTDSASNMINAVNSIFPNNKKHIPCMAHKLSHVVPKSIQKTFLMQEIINKVKAIVTAVRKSVVLSDKLTRLQKRDGKSEGSILKFKQDVPTRWNSTFYMIERFLLLRDYIYPVLLKCPVPPEMITREEFEILNDVVNLLRPIELVTNEIGGDLYPTCSIIIPIIRCMINAITKCIPITDHGLNLKNNILSEIEERFHNIESYQMLTIATILDPRFKRLHFQQPRAVSLAISTINAAMQTETDINSNASPESVIEHNSALWNFHDTLVATSTVTRDDPGGINVELRQYLNQCVIPRNHDPLKAWQTLKHAYSTLFNIAKKYLALVATSVPSERLFSKAGIIKSQLRNRLTASRLNTLLFLGSLTLEEWELT